MFANLNTFVLIVAYAGAAYAQNTTTTGSAPTSQPTGLTGCQLLAFNVAAASSPCNGQTNTTCICTNTDFYSIFENCLNACCDSQEAAAANQYMADQCGYTSLNSSSTTLSSSTPTSSAAGLTVARSNSAGMTSTAISFEILVGALVASASVLVGSALVL